MTLALHGVTRRVGDQTHIHETELSLADRSVNVLLGPTGAGKTSLLRLLAGLDAPSSGRVVDDGRDVTGAPVRRRSVAMVYQQFINYPSFTVFENIASPLRRAGVRGEALRQAVDQAAGQLRIRHLLDRLPAALSGGQQQRVAIARALAKDARLLLLDEPLVNLDYKLREELREELRELFARRAAIVVYATTEPQEALLIGGNALIVEEGRVLQSGPTLAVYRNPATVRVGRVFSDPPINLLSGRIAAGRIGIAGLSLAVPPHMRALPDGDYRFGIRAGHLALAQSEAGEASFEAAVDLAEINGSETFVHTTLAGEPVVIQATGVHTLQLGQRIAVFLNPLRLFAFGADDRLAASPGGSPTGSLAA